MEDSTPGSTEDHNQGVQQTSPETTQQQPADTGQQATSNDDTSQGASADTPQVGQDSGTDNQGDDSQSSSDNQPDEVAEWAKKQGYDLDNLTPEQAKTLAKRVIDNQKSFHSVQQKLKTVEEFSKGTADVFDDDSGENPIVSEANKALAAIRTETFFNKNPDAEPYAGKMVELIQAERETYGDEAARILANNLPRLLTLAKAEGLDAEASANYDKGRQDERQNLAKSQQAGAPAANANNGAPQSQATTDKDIGNMSTAEYLQWRKDHNPWTDVS